MYINLVYILINYNTLYDINNKVSIVKKLKRGKNIDNPVHFDNPVNFDNPENKTVNPQNINPDDIILRGPHEQYLAVNNISLNNGEEKINITNPN